MPVPSRLPGRSPRRTGGCAARRSRRSTGRSSTHPCGAGRSRPTSGSAGWHPARRSSRSPATPPATTAPPRSLARSRSAPSRPRRVLLIADLGRPERFLNMMRIFKPRSPMNTGAWCLVAFSGSGALAVGCDLIGRPKAARALGALTSLFGSYLGSYTGVLLACTAVPVWSRQPDDPRTGIRRHRDRHRGGRDPPRARGERPTARPPDPQGARHDRDRLDADRALDLGPRRAAARRRRPGARPRAPRPLLPYRQEPRRARSLAPVGRAPHWPA